jgi:hypothetical protein
LISIKFTSFSLSEDRRQIIESKVMVRGQRAESSTEQQHSVSSSSSSSSSMPLLSTLSAKPLRTTGTSRRSTAATAVTQRAVTASLTRQSKGSGGSSSGGSGSSGGGGGGNNDDGKLHSTPLAQTRTSLYDIQSDDTINTSSNIIKATMRKRTSTSRVRSERRTRVKSSTDKSTRQVNGLRDKKRHRGLDSREETGRTDEDEKSEKKATYSSNDCDWVSMTPEAFALANRLTSSEADVTPYRPDEKDKWRFEQARIQAEASI